MRTSQAAHRIDLKGLDSRRELVDLGQGNWYFPECILMVRADILRILTGVRALEANLLEG